MVGPLCRIENWCEVEEVEELLLAAKVCHLALFDRRPTLTATLSRSIGSSWICTMARTCTRRPLSSCGSELSSFGASTGSGLISPPSLGWPTTKTTRRRRLDPPSATCRSSARITLPSSLRVLDGSLKRIALLRSRRACLLPDVASHKLTSFLLADLHRRPRRSRVPPSPCHHGSPRAHRRRRLHHLPRAHHPHAGRGRIRVPREANRAVSRRCASS